MTNLIQTIKQDWIAHDKDWTKPGFRAIAVCRFGQWRMTISSKLLRAPVSFIYRLLYRRCRNIYGIDLPYTVKLGNNVIIEHSSGIIIHGHAEIGDGCIIRQGVTIGNRHMSRPYEVPILGKNVNVGAGAKILGDVKIADNVNIGANSVVIKDMGSNNTIAGIPAKKIAGSYHIDDLHKNRT